MRSASNNHRGGLTPVVLTTLAVAAGVGLWVMIAPGGGAAGGGKSDTFPARRGDFDVTIPASGELVALQQIEIRNRLDTQATITEIVAEGKWVNAGEVVLRLNDDELKNKVNDAADAVNLADAAAAAADAELRITLKEQESELSKAQLAVTLADLALKAWTEGEDPSKRSELALALETATKNYTRLDERFKESAKLLEQKFISVDEYKQDEIALIEAKAKLKQAELDVKVYEEYQVLQDAEKKRSDLDQARGELERTTDRFKAKVHSAQTDLDSKKYQLESKKERLRLLEKQLADCTLTAPSPGLVVYYSSLESAMRWGDSEGPPQVGSKLWPNQTVIVLPDTSKMVASVKVNEALSGQIAQGQRAVVTSDAISDQVLHGEVLSIGVLAATGGWRDPNRRDYTVRIQLAGDNTLGLKPSMRCKADIYVGRVENATYVPIQAVFRDGPTAFVYVPDGSGFSQQAVKIGRSSELYVEVTDGLDEHEVVLLRQPKPEEIVATLKDGKDKADGIAPEAAPDPKGPGPGARTASRRPTEGS